jgi:hypothetical protein
MGWSLRRSLFWKYSAGTFRDSICCCRISTKVGNSCLLVYDVICSESRQRFWTWRQQSSLRSQSFLPYVTEDLDLCQHRSDCLKSRLMKENPLDKRRSLVLALQRLLCMMKMYSVLNCIIFLCHIPSMENFRNPYEIYWPVNIFIPVSLTAINREVYRTLGLALGKWTVSMKLE